MYTIIGIYPDRAIEVLIFSDGATLFLVFLESQLIPFVHYWILPVKDSTYFKIPLYLKKY